MGLRESKFSFLPYEEAVKRVKNDELERIKLAFKRSSANSNLMPKNAFLCDILGDIMPKRLAEHLYMACGGGNKGICFKDVVCCLVLITSGTAEEKAKFVFSMISVDGCNITCEDIENFLIACDNGHLPTSAINLFSKTDKLTFEAFFSWLLQNENFSEVTKWLLFEQRGTRRLRLSSVDDTPSFYQSLGKITKLSQNDLIELEKRYWNLKSSSVSGKFDQKVLASHISPPLPWQFCEGFFKAFDENRDAHIDFKEMVLGIAACSRGSTTERLTFVFRIFDRDCDGILSEEELKMMFDGLVNVYQSACGQDASINIDEMVKKLTAGKEKTQLTKSEFLSWASNNYLIKEFLLLLSQICHIVFGLRPNTGEEEGFIIRRWIEREQRNGLSIGNLYYLISSSWWNTWMEYVQYKPRSLNITPKRDSTSTCTSRANSTWANIEVNESNRKRFSDSDYCENTKRESQSSINLATRRSTSIATQIQVEPSNEENGQIDTVTNLVTNLYPGSIDNNVLIIQADQKKQIQNLTGEGGKLKSHIIRGRDFQVLPEPVWKALFAWYGGNTPLPRTVIFPRDDRTSATIELYPVQLHLYRHTPTPRHITLSLNSFGINHLPFHTQSNNANNAQQPSLPTPPRRTLLYYASFSKKNTVKQVLEFLCCRLKIKFEDMRLWDFSESQPILLEDEHRTLESYGIRDGHHVLIEVRNRDMSWPEEMNSLVATKNFRERSNTGQLVKGATGLHNLGNTCFMNSAVQCLSNTYPLTMYFISKMHLFELNRTNPLGMKGMLAKRYGDLVYDLWNGLYRSIAPVKLRWTIGKYASQFTGFQQHDAQEFISFLLDGLHEDLNRVHDKPYIELKDSAGRPDKEVAHEAWENHRKRNQSIMVDLFQGQLKSQVRCLECGNCSVRFDPYTFLSLPIPMENSLHLLIVLFTMNGATPVEYGLLLCNDADVKLLKCQLQKLSGISAEKLVIAEVYGAVIVDFLPDGKKIRDNINSVLYAYEVLKQPKLFSGSIQSPSIQRSTSSTTTATQNSSQSLEPAVLLGGSSAGANSLPLKQSRSPRKARNILPFRRMDKRPNGIVPAHPEMVGAKAMNGNLPLGRSRTGNAELSTECLCDMGENANSGIIVLMHRKMIQMDAYYLSWQKFRPLLFGIPVIISCEKTTKKCEIYNEVWRQVERFISTPNTEKRDKNDKNCPFELKMVRKDGQFCACCPWYRFCRGCTLQYDDTAFDNTCCYLSIDWDPTILHLKYQQGQEKIVVEHPSIQESTRLLREPINIDQCLKDFTKEEELGDDETWYCSECKKHQKIAKTFSLWSLPPILIIHLKRFQLLNNRWIKSNKIVKFPMRNFDPSSYLVERDRRKRNPSERTPRKILTVKSSENSSISSDTPTLPEKIQCEQREQDVSSNADCSCNKDNRFSLDIDDIEQSLAEEDDCTQTDDNFNYRLYAISCHSGMLNGGHYVCHARNPNGKWYMYNDSSCKEIDPSIVENESPYMLFFEKEGMNISDYLPDIRDNNLDISSDDDEFESDVKRYCVIQ